MGNGLGSPASSANEGRFHLSDFKPLNLFYKSGVFGRNSSSVVELLLFVSKVDSQEEEICQSEKFPRILQFTIIYF